MDGSSDGSAGVGRAGRGLAALLLGVGLVVAVLLSLSGRPADALFHCDRYVLNTRGTDSGDCADPNAPCESVQYAVGQAKPNDIICVANEASAPGGAPYGGTIEVTKTVTLAGYYLAECDGGPLSCDFTPEECDVPWVTLDAGGAGRVISITGDISPVIDCFVITGGNADGLGGDEVPGGENDVGGGIYSSGASPVILHNVITGNYGCSLCPSAYGRGGGIYLAGASNATVAFNVISGNVGNNTTWGIGGGMLVRDSNAWVQSNTIQLNTAGDTAGYGGGIALISSTGTITDNDILTNTAGYGVQGEGGGVYITTTLPVTLAGNLIRNNTALDGTPVPTGMISYGGGVYWYSDPAALVVVRDNTIAYNQAGIEASGRGGGLYLLEAGPAAHIEVNTFEWNGASRDGQGLGGALFLDDCEATTEGNCMRLNEGSSLGYGAGGAIVALGGAGVITDNTINDNVGSFYGEGLGGGVAIRNSQTALVGNRLSSNSATWGCSSCIDGGRGGGLLVYDSDLRIVRNNISYNWAGQDEQGQDVGGGLYVRYSDVVLDANTVLYNHATGTTGSRAGAFSLADCPAITVTNNVIAGNEVLTDASGIHIENSVGVLAHNTLAENLQGDGIAVTVGPDTDLVLYSNIIVSHTVGISNTAPGASSVDAKYTLFEGNTQDFGPDVDSKYEIAGPAALSRFTYHLLSQSKAIDAAPLLSYVTHDIDGQPRPFGPKYDVGADEAGPFCYMPVVLLGA